MTGHRPWHRSAQVGPAEPVRGRVGEAVHDAAIKVHLPVYLAGAHLLLERTPLVGVDAGIVGADADEDLASDRGGILRPHGRKTTVEADDTGNVCPAPGEFERHGATEAVADRGDPDVTSLPTMDVVEALPAQDAASPRRANARLRPG